MTELTTDPLATEGWSFHDESDAVAEHGLDQSQPRKSVHLIAAALGNRVGELHAQATPQARGS